MQKKKFNLCLASWNDTKVTTEKEVHIPGAIKTARRILQFGGKGIAHGEKRMPSNSQKTREEEERPI